MNSRFESRDPEPATGNSPRPSRLYTQTQGAGQDLVLVHGWGLHGGVWDDIVDRLASGYRTTAVDLPGYGRSPAPPTYELASVAAQVAEAVPGPAAWLGWSLGATVALAAALHWPAQVERLILVGATPRFLCAPGWQCAMDETVMRGFHDDLGRNYRKTLQRFLSLHGGKGNTARHVVRRLREELSRFGHPGPDSLRGGLAILASTDLRGVLQQIRVPVQLIHGGRDVLVPMGAAEYMTRMLPHARLERISGAGHAPFLSHPGLFTETVAAFLG